jgi:hypothetical protein
MHPDEIAELYYLRRTNQGEDIERIRTMKAILEGEIVLPLPEIGQNEKPAVANLMQQGMAQLSRRIASVEPSMYFPTVDPDDDESVNRAQDRLRVMGAWHKDNKMKRRLGKRGRYFLAYASAPVVIKPRADKRIPRWIVKDPFGTFPAEDCYEDYLPPDCIFLTTHTYGALKKIYDYDLLHSVQLPSSWDYENDVANDEVKFEVLEYIDDVEDHLVLLGHDASDGYPSMGAGAVTLLHAPNLTSMPLAVVPGSINLDKQLGHFDGIVGMYQTQAALMALTVIAQRRAVWPREWAVANPGESFEVVSVPDPAMGQPGEIRGGRLESQTLDPSFRALEMMDRMEYGMRQGAGLPPEFGGASGTNIRTGRRGAQVMGASIDFTIAEAQDIFADSLVEENKIAMAIDKAYFKGSKRYLIATRSFSGTVKYAPSKLWENDAHVVDYPIAGTDLANLPIEGGQRVAMQTMSREKFMEIDPVITDPKAEMQRIQREGIGAAFLTSVQTMAADPAGPYQPIHLARLDEKLASGLELYEAVKQLQEEIQKEQAKAAAEAQQPATDPSMQPGLSMPGQGVEAPPAIPEGQPSMQNLTALLGQLGTAQTAQAYRPTG